MWHTKQKKRKRKRKTKNLHLALLWAMVKAALCHCLRR
jgi:hypothetical protein